MTKFPRLRCPVCGLLPWLRNLKRFHSLDAYVQDFGGRGHCVYEREEVPNLRGFWIKRLKEVIEWLEKEELESSPLPSNLILISPKSSVRRDYGVSEKSVSPMTGRSGLILESRSVLKRS